MSARKRKAVPARLSPDHLRPGSDESSDPEVDGYSDHDASGSGNGDDRAAAAASPPEVRRRDVSGDDVMESIRSLIVSAPTVEDKQKRLNAMIHQLQLIRDQLTRQRLQQVRYISNTCQLHPENFN